MKMIFFLSSSDVLASQEQQMNEIVTIDQREYSFIEFAHLSVEMLLY